jgi:hypothetical protein
MTVIAGSYSKRWTGSLPAAVKAKQMDRYVSEQHPDVPSLAEDQAALRDLLSSLRLSENNDDVIPTLVPPLDLSDPEFLINLIGDDFFIGEAIAHTRLQHAQKLSCCR